MSTLLNQLNEILNKDYHVNYWSDEVVDRVAEILNQFKDNDWQLLSNIWQTKSEDWQVKLAESLSGCDPFHRASQLLVEMLRSSSRRLGIAVVENLEVRDDVFIPTEEMRNDLERLLIQVEEAEKFEIRNLLSKIS